MKKGKRILALVLATATLLATAGCGAKDDDAAAGSPPPLGDQEYELHAATAVAENDHDRHTIKLRAFKEEVEEKTNGKVKIVIHFGAELGGEREYVEMMQTGDLDFASLATSVLSGFTDSMKFYDMPMMFKDEEQLLAFTESDLGKSKLEALKDIDLVGLAAGPAGTRDILTIPSKPVTCLADLKGMKIRVMETPIHIEGMEMLGAQPIPMPYNECYQSMQTGVIDGMENEMTTYMTQRFYEVAPNFSQVAWLNLVNLTLASKKTMDSLPVEYQEIITTAAENATIKAAEEGMAYDETEGIQALKDAGATVIDVDVEEFRDALQPLIDENTDLIGQDVLDWIAAN